jgi:putative copper resistance protein D
MGWFGADIDAPMVAVRAVHLAASAVTAGVLIFRAAVLVPASRDAPQALSVAPQLRLIVWLALAISVVSGLAWFVLQAASMSGLAIGEAMAPEMLSTVLYETQFGHVMLARSLCALVLAACLGFDRIPGLRWLGLAAGLGLVGAIAWTGHAGATAGGAGVVHLAADVLHLWAAAAWTGGLLALVLLLLALGLAPEAAAARIAAVRRFSTLGLVSVATLIVSGAVHYWILVGSLQAMAVTAYGRLLMVKLVLFAVMLALAAANRLWLTPRLKTAAAERSAMMLTCSAFVELVLALAVFALVGALGTQHPAAHFMI